MKPGIFGLDDQLHVLPLSLIDAENVTEPPEALTRIVVAAAEVTAREVKPSMTVAKTSATRVFIRCPLDTKLLRASYA